MDIGLYYDSTLLETARTEPDGKFKFTKKLSAGKYKVRALDPNNEYCWEKQEQTVDVDETASVDLVQKGYKARITSTHDIKFVGDQPLSIHRGENIICVNKPQASWKVQSDCWFTASDKYEWSCGQNIDVVVTEYLIKGTIRVEGDVNSTDVSVLIK